MASSKEMARDTYSAAPEVSIHRGQQRVNWKSPILRLWALRSLWIILSCVGLPIMLRLLDYNLLQPGGHIVGQSNGLPCDVEPLWSSWAALLEPNVRTGHMSFAAAKVIDVVFDLVVSRCGQLLLAWYSGRIIRDVLVRLAMEHGVDLQLFYALALDTNSLSAALRSQTAWRWTKSRRTIIILSTVSLTILYVVAFPTLASTATSPVGATRSSILLPNDDTVGVDPFIQSAAFRFNNTGVPGAPTSWVVLAREIRAPPGVVGNRSVIMQLTGASYGGYGVAHLGPYDLTLQNGTWYALANDTQTDCGFYYENEYVLGNSKGVAQSDPYLLFSDRLLCVPDGDAYVWGASWELLFLISILHIVWSIMLLVLSIEASYKCDLVRKGKRSLATWQALTDLGTVLYSLLHAESSAQATGQELEVPRKRQLVTYEQTYDEVNGRLGLKLKAV
ncbi:hypothetical protein F4778DRAFT_781809 [Xylariomycetidae sp. FL2044]|nr:hypothetical protein F4778DRAFT_781809 [Xylariomycetidae sp. FL2044]